MTMSTLGLSGSAVIQIVSTYVVAQETIDAVTPGPGWQVVGAFFLPVDMAVRVEVIGLVDSGNELDVQLFDMTALEVVDSSLTAVTATSDTRVLSPAFDLDGGHLYQYWAQVIGSAGGGTLRSAQLLSA
jgi:hypothetical protein